MKNWRQELGCWKLRSGGAPMPGGRERDAQWLLHAYLCTQQVGVCETPLPNLFTWLTSGTLCSLAGTTCSLVSPQMLHILEAGLVLALPMWSISSSGAPHKFHVLLKAYPAYHSLNGFLLWISYVALIYSVFCVLLIQVNSNFFNGNFYLYFSLVIFNMLYSLFLSTCFHSQLKI